MVESFDVVKSPNDVAFYAGVLFSSYSISQAITTMYWGPLSDRIGRRPTLLVGLVGDLATFVLFGLSKSFTWALVTRTMNGFFAGNAAVVKSVIAEISDDTNRPRMMAMVPFMWHVGIMGGAALGGLLADPANQYPGVFGHIELFRTYPYLLPCMAGSVTTTLGLVAGLFMLEETLVPSHRPRPAGADEDCLDSEATPLVARVQQAPVAPVWTSEGKRVLAMAWLLALATAIGDHVYPIFAATDPSSGGLGFMPRSIGASLMVAGFAVVYLQLVAYPRLVHKHGVLRCFQLGSQITVPYFFATPFLSLLAAHLGRTLGSTAAASMATPDPWMSSAGLEYCLMWVLLVGLLLLRIVGNVLAFTSMNLLVSNIAPSKDMLGTVNSVQQLGAVVTRITGPLISGTLWGWSAGNGLPYPLNSHLVWILCGGLMVLSWRASLTLPASVNNFAAGR
ncbi:hypothetical protein LPJ61_000346 [Coemansia biformis]|uniref:Major facilitator superfamily (MFS) profile domain-containing protein n=1 Tax=Coemansia biformis TaxID=1286918 RepID=A0A9W7YH78_9FUNG|nr:hypothetical protein LPJ61_000346 [Coemansia biformis]